MTETVSETEQNSRSSRSCEETLAYTPQAKNTTSFTYESAVRDEAHAEDPAAWKQVEFQMLAVHIHTSGHIMRLKPVSFF